MRAFAHLIVYRTARVKHDEVNTKVESADAKNKGKVLTLWDRALDILSLFGSTRERPEMKKAEAWLDGVVDKLARPHKGGDTDQIRGVTSGECQIAPTNTHYLARLMRSDQPEDRAVMGKVGIVFHNQDIWGTHVNIAGAAVASHAKHGEAARKFLEYLASDEAQVDFANGNNEWPAVPSVKPRNLALERMDPFGAETIPVSVVGMNQVKVQQLLDRVGYG